MMEGTTERMTYFCSLCGHQTLSETNLCLFCSGRIPYLESLGQENGRDMNGNSNFSAYPSSLSQYEDSVSDIALAFSPNNNRRLAAYNTEQYSHDVTYPRHDDLLTEADDNNASSSQWYGNESRSRLDHNGNVIIRNDYDDTRYNHDYEQDNYWGPEELNEEHSYSRERSSNWRGRGQRSNRYRGQWDQRERGYVDDSWGDESGGGGENIRVYVGDSSTRNDDVDPWHADVGGQVHRTSNRPRTLQLHRRRGPPHTRGRQQRQPDFVSRVRDDVRARWVDARQSEINSRRSTHWSQQHRRGEQLGQQWTPQRRSLHFQRHQRPRPWSHDRNWSQTDREWSQDSNPLPQPSQENNQSSQLSQPSQHREWSHDRRQFRSRPNNRYRWRRWEVEGRADQNQESYATQFPARQDRQRWAQDATRQQHNERQESEGHAEVNQAMNQSPRQAMNQSARQAMNQSTRQAMNQSTHQAANHRDERDRVQIFSISQRIRHAVDAIRKVTVCEDKVGSPCTICFETFTLSEQTAQLPCQHLFHDTCIKTWLCRQPTCPLCRTSLLMDDRRRQRLQGY